MLAILQQFHTYLPHAADGGYEPQLFTGDQLTVERAVNMISSVANDTLLRIVLKESHFNLVIGMLELRFCL